jgi:hypothetical protein
LAGGGVEHGLRALGVGNELAVDQVADGGGDVLVVVHGDFNKKCRQRLSSKRQQLSNQEFRRFLAGHRPGR